MKDKDEQKQHLIDMMKSDEELGLYDDYESYDKKQFKHEVTVIPKEEIIGKRPEKYSERFDNDKSPIGNPETWGKRMVDESREIKIENIFNDVKREGAKRVIQQHKVLRGLSLVNPIHLFRVSDGHGEFPDGYKLTEKGIQYIIEQLYKE
jgi:hypothetical protein